MSVQGPIGRAGLRPLVAIAILVSVGIAAGAIPSRAESQGLKQQKSQNLLKTAPRTVTTTTPTATIAPPTTTALTSGECRGLGGFVEANPNCAKNGMPNACKTVDVDGVVRVMCIDEVRK